MSEEDKAELKSKAKKAYDAKDFTTALRLYTQGTVDFPTESTFWGNRSQVFFCMNEFENSIADSMKALELDPKFAKCYTRIGNSLVHLGQLDQAKKEYQKSYDLSKDEDNKLRIQGVEQCEKDWKTTKEFMQYKKYSEAVYIFEQLVQKISCNAEMWYDYISCLFTLERYDEILAAMVPRMDRPPFLHDKAARYWLASTYFHFSLLDEAEKHLNLLSDMPDGAYYKDVAAMRRKCEDLQQIIRNVVTLTQGKKYEWAYDALTKALAQDNLLPNQRRLLLTHRAIQLNCLARYQEALEDCNAALKGGEKGHWRVRAYQCRGYCHEALDNIQDAMDDYEQALKCKPDIPKTKERLEYLKKMRPTKRNFYLMLGVTSKATKEEIKRAFHKLAKDNHPDKAGTNTEEVKKRTEAMQRLNEAYAVLSDDEKRARYDAGDMGDSGENAMPEFFEMCCGTLPDNPSACQSCLHGTKKVLFMSGACLMATLTCPCWCPYFWCTRKEPRPYPDDTPP